MSLGSSFYRSAECRRRRWSTALLIIGAVTAGACAPSNSVPAPRPLIVRSGARINAEQDRLNEIDEWVRVHQDDIVMDPSFLIIEGRTTEEVYPWEALTITGDTATVQVYGAAPESGSFMSLYAHFHLMDMLGELDEFLPEAMDAVGYPLERAILVRVSDAWLYGRAAFDMSPYGPLDELMFANENGFLDAFILTARPDEFEEARLVWAEENPGRSEEYHRWFRRTFEIEPPGSRTAEPR